MEPLGLPVSRSGEQVLGGVQKRASGKSHPSPENLVTLRPGQTALGLPRNPRGAQILLFALGAEEPGPSRGLG